MQGSIRERSPGVWQVRVSLGRDPLTRRYRYASTTVRGGRREAQRAAAALVSQASNGQVARSTETLEELLSRWLEHQEGIGRAPKTIAENRRIARELSDSLGHLS